MTREGIEQLYTAAEQMSGSERLKLIDSLLHRFRTIEYMFPDYLRIKTLSKDIELQFRCAYCGKFLPERKVGGDNFNSLVCPDCEEFAAWFERLQNLFKTSGIACSISDRKTCREFFERESPNSKSSLMNNQ